MFQPKSETFLILNYDDIDTLINENYDKEYEVLMEGEYSNDSLYRHNVIDREFSKWDMVNINNFLNTESNRLYPSLALRLLARDGHIPYGKYLIQVSW